jgi:hypothetical protein
MEDNMVTCPWCRTHYQAFQPNCSNCGGPLPAPPQEADLSARERIAKHPPSPPPLPPRPIPKNLVWKRLGNDGWAITAGILALIGAIFFIVGLPLTITLVAAFVGLPFMLLGLGFLAFGLPTIYLRYKNARQIERILAEGQATLGKIDDTSQNYLVSINNRNPWDIRYHFQAQGKEYQGKLTTLNTPGPAYQPGEQIYIVYDPQTPTINILYPPL